METVTKFENPDCAITRKERERIEEANHKLAMMIVEELRALLELAKAAGLEHGILLLDAHEKEIVLRRKDDGWGIFVRKYGYDMADVWSIYYAEFEENLLPLAYDLNLERLVNLRKRLEKSL